MPDVVHEKPIGGRRGARLQIDDMECRLDRGLRGRCRKLDEVAAAGRQRILARPDHARGEPAGDRGRLPDLRNDVAAGGVDLVREGESYGLPGCGPIDIAVKGDDSIDAGGLPGRQYPNRHARIGLATRDQSAVAAKVGTRAADQLNGQRKGRRGDVATSTPSRYASS